MIPDQFSCLLFQCGFALLITRKPVFHKRVIRLGFSVVHYPGVPKLGGFACKTENGVLLVTRLFHNGKFLSKIPFPAHLLIVDGNRQSLLILFRRADTFRFIVVPPQGCPSGCRSIQQVIRSDARRSTCKMFFDLWEYLS